MKNKIFIIIVICSTAFGVFTAFKSPKETNIKKYDSQTFSLQNFSDNLQTALNGKTMGYGFVIYGGANEKPDIVYTHGLKRTKKDGGNLPFDYTSRMHIASMSKTLTAIASIQLLMENNLPVNTLIKDYLPANWERGRNIDKLTFKDLLTHMSGIRANGQEKCSGESYEQLECKIKQGVNPDSMYVYSYQNMNFALLRILIPKLEGFEHLEKNNDTSTAFKYIRYVKRNVINRSDPVNEPICYPEKSENVYYYNWPYGKGHGQRFYNYAQVCGAYGWYISVLDYGKIIHKLFYSDDILKSAWRDTMTSGSLGCYTYGGKHGGYFWHNGGWDWTDNNGSGKMNSCWMYFPDGVIAVAIVNSDIPGWWPDIMAHAYDKAWKKK